MSDATEHRAANEPILVLVSPQLADEMHTESGYRIDRPCRMYLTPLETGSWDRTRYGATYEMIIREDTP